MGNNMESKMYLTSKKLMLVSEEELKEFEKNENAKLPKAYCEFIKTLGIGTYCGIIVTRDPEKFPDEDNEVYDWWDFENAPITKEQLSECVVLATSIDGDYIAIHNSFEGYILLPRQDDAIHSFELIENDFIGTLREVMNCLFGDMDTSLEYFETVNDGYLQVHYKDGELNDLAETFKKSFKYDFLIDDGENTCEVFIKDLGGSVRFNLAYGEEIVICYCDYGVDCLEKIKDFFAGDKFTFIN